MKNQYKVVQEFEATAAISARKRKFEVGDFVLSDSSGSDSQVVVEVDEFFFFADRMVFEAACELIKGGLV
jgi:hypothetical protein